MEALAAFGKYTTACLTSVPLAKVEFSLPSVAAFFKKEHALLSDNSFRNVWVTESEGIGVT